MEVRSYFHSGIMFFFLNLRVLNGLTGLSEEAKVRDLENRIIVVSRNERNGLLIIPMGVFLVGAGLIFNTMGAIENSGPAYIGGIFVSVLGIFSTLFGFYVTVHYANQYNNLLKERECKS
jgi:uncharacterized membrane-anchored protein